MRPVVKGVGYWKSPPIPCSFFIDPRYRKALDRWKAMGMKRLERPEPYNLSGSSYKVGKGKIIKFLESGVVAFWQMGYEQCRLCDIDPDRLGCEQRTDGEWLWPSSLVHYVSEHNVRLPDDFIESMNRAEFQVDPSKCEWDDDPEVNFDFLHEWTLSIRGDSA